MDRDLSCSYYSNGQLEIISLIGATILLTHRIKNKKSVSFMRRFALNVLAPPDKRGGMRANYSVLPATTCEIQQFRFPSVDSAIADHAAGTIKK